MKFRYVPSLALPLACAPQQELIDSRHPEKPPIACPSKLEERITCIKKAIAQTGTLEDAQSFCEGKPLILCQIDVMQKHGNDFSVQEDPVSACTSSVNDSGKRTVELQCLLGNFSLMLQAQSDIHSDLQACDEGVLTCYEQAYSQLP
ncbi:MAG: hypothetical protein R3B71_00700 [Candidatus Gracilibacteria bacterium]|nr:hypothetical protein [Candidatus Peregrinibacteria bacterium]